MQLRTSPTRRSLLATYAPKADMDRRSRSQQRGPVAPAGVATRRPLKSNGQTEHRVLAGRLGRGIAQASNVPADGTLVATSRAKTSARPKAAIENLADFR